MRQGPRKGSLRVLHGSSSIPQRALESTYAHHFPGIRLASTRPNIYVGHVSAPMIPKVVTAVRSCADPHGWAHWAPQWGQFGQTGLCAAVTHTHTHTHTTHTVQQHMDTTDYASLGVREKRGPRLPRTSAKEARTPLPLKVNSKHVGFPTTAPHRAIPDATRRGNWKSRPRL